MISSIDIKQYKKLKNLKLDFTAGVNAISGTNGTCKTSLLYMISNSFQELTTKNNNLIDLKALDAIKRLNDNLNPKIESITKGDKTGNDPAPGVPGILYDIKYMDETVLGFRRHNSRKQSQFPRYSMKPLYRSGESNSLPVMPIIYLGLARLVPFGEVHEEASITSISINLPSDYITSLNDVYSKLTGINVNEVRSQSIKGLKKRADFTSLVDGVDSNTISAGEDNIRIILNALYCLKYYYETLLSSDKEIESILIIDEFDATLHPSMQVQLFEIVKDFSDRYKIQVFFTTHSLYLIEKLLQSRQNVIYLVDNYDEVACLESPSIVNIEKFLKDKISFNVYTDKYIPVLTEDPEARFFIEILFSYLKEKDPEGFGRAVSYFHLIDVSFGSGVLEKLFADKYMGKITLNAICILDGDQESNLNDNVISLPGSDNPEQVLFKYAQGFLVNETDFWSSKNVLDTGMNKHKFIISINRSIEEIETSIVSLREAGKSTSGKKREKQKKVFNDNFVFFKLAANYWVQDKEKQSCVQLFYDNLYKMFQKVSVVNGLHRSLWSEKIKLD